MADSSGKKIGSPDFNPEKYVKDLSQRCVGGQELQQQRQKIQALSEETNVLLKKNVYQNYMQFIETAKEISHLESEMYQLSHMLAEQRSLFSSIKDMSLLGDKGPKHDHQQDKKKQDKERKEDEERQKLASILEKVEGCVSLLETPGRQLVHDGDLLELDPCENTALQRVHGYLLSDGLMLATWVPNRRGPVRYKFQAMHELSSLAVVNVKDFASVRYAFKLLVFPDTRLFQCNTVQSKKEWLESFEKAKKARLAQEQQKRESAVVSTSSPTRPPRASSVESKNPFGDPVDDDEDDESHSKDDEVEELPEWVTEVAEDLDVSIAQRHFEDAYALLVRAREYFQSRSGEDDPVVQDIKRKVEARGRALTEALTRELEVSPDKSLQGGLRAARRAVRLLNLLGRSSQACELLLLLCSSLLRAQLRRVKREGSTALYVHSLSSVFFSNLADMAREFMRAFPSSPACTSAFVVWVGGELNQFASHLVKQVFMPQTSISTLAECVSAVRAECEQLSELGLDVRYQVDGLLRAPLSRSLAEAKEKLAESVKLRAGEDRWRPMNLQSRAGLTRFLQDCSAIGLDKPLQAHISGECWLTLTSNTVAFGKLFLTLLEDCIKLATPELMHTMDGVLESVSRAHLRHVESSLRDSKLKAEGSFVRKNATFLLDVIFPMAERRYKDGMGRPCTQLARLRQDNLWMKEDKRSDSPSKRDMSPKPNATTPKTAMYSTVGYI
ncbi:exocyst complex component 8 [Hetaerina americana]|uniref:exocyst complex component 8 n=1 Tax=Hetaerina americana TaxID=62018 RepID=UPI003A7F23E6